MARRFYLSFVYDLNGYDRYDILSNDSLKELDDIITNFKDRNELLDKYYKDYNIDRKRGKVCIITEDLDVKKREIKLYGSPESHTKEEIDDLYTYAHLIPVMYKGDRLLNIDTCLLILKYKLFQKGVIDSIILDKKIKDKKTKEEKIISINKKFIFETDNEKNLVDIECDYREALSYFYKRLKSSSSEEQYYYCRALMDICDLKYRRKKKVTNLKISKKIKEIEQNMELTPADYLERESENMDEFYLHHDLDDVIKYSPDSNRPIGSERKKK